MDSRTYIIAAREAGIEQMSHISHLCSESLVIQARGKCVVRGRKTISRATLTELLGSYLVII